MYSAEVTFQNRQEELNLLLSENNPFRLLNIFGEAGIGKTRLIREAVHQLRRASTALALFVDLATLPENWELWKETLLLIVIRGTEGLVYGNWRTPEQIAAEVVAQLSNLAQGRRVYLFFDTTEKVQDEREFWDWLEEHLAGPLAADGRVRQVYAGRARAPWRHFETRYYLQHCRLLPLRGRTDERPVVNLMYEVFDKVVSQGRAVELALDKAKNLVSNLADRFSCGHPGLAQEIAAYLGQQMCKGCDVAVSWPELQKLEKQIAEEVIGPFADQHFLAGLPDGWPVILREACVLDWFDSIVLWEYLRARQLQQSSQREWERLFRQGMADLTSRYAVVEWDEQVGAYRLAGTLQEILRRQLRAADPEKYCRANLTIAEVLHTIANDYFRDNQIEHGRLLRNAEQYRHRAQQQEALA